MKSLNLVRSRHPHDFAAAAVSGRTTLEAHSSGHPLRIGVEEELKLKVTFTRCVHHRCAAGRAGAMGAESASNRLAGVGCLPLWRSILQFASIAGILGIPGIVVGSLLCCSMTAGVRLDQRRQRASLSLLTKCATLASRCYSRLRQG